MKRKSHNATTFDMEIKLAKEEIENKRRHLNHWYTRETMDIEAPKERSIA